MKQSVRDYFVIFTAPLEGIVRWPYLDILGLVTVGIGNLIDPVKYALAVPFVMLDGSEATDEQITEGWNALKSQPHLAQAGHPFACAVSGLRLTEEGISQVVSGKLDEMASYLANRFPAFETWPADAQLGTLSLAWACGPAFRFTTLEANLKALNFHAASDNCKMNETGNPGLKPRNIANHHLFRNAAIVLERGLDPEVLYYPGDARSLHGNAPPAPETAPDLDPVPVAFSLDGIADDAAAEATSFDPTPAPEPKGKRSRR
jgi:GH24 family phage-related lysozyme (muramidase)